MNVERNFVLGDPLVGKLPDQMSGHWSAKLPAEFLPQRFDVVEELACGDFGSLVEISFALSKCLADIAFHFALQGVRAQNKRPTKIGLPMLEDRAQVQKENVISSDHQIRRIVIIGKQGILARANDALMPIGGDAIHLLG